MTRSLRAAQTVSSLAGLLVGACAFFLTLLDYGTDFTRTATRPGWFSNFYDMQARAFLAGHLDVAPGSLGIEGFIVDGKTYTYFAPLPSVLRIPILLITDKFDGRLTLVSMAAGWLVFAGFTTALVWAVRRWFFGDEAPSRFEALLAGLFIAGATGGTVLTYDASLPWVYHEAYLWASATAVGGLYWLVRTVELPTLRNGLWLGGFAIAAIMSRIPAGWAVSGASLLVAAWLLLPSRRRRFGQLWSVFLMGGVVPIAAGIAYNQSRFHHPWLFPLDKQVWTQVNEHRRQALAVNGGTITGPQFLPTSFGNYFSPLGVRFVDHFPWITLPAQPAKAYAGAYLDQVYRTGSVPALMPLLFALTVVAMISLLRWRKNQRLRPLLFVFLGGVGVSAGVMGYGYLSNRYVSDFVPGVVVGGTIGLWAVARWVGARHHRRLACTAVASGMTALAAFGIAANMATGLDMARTTWKGDKLVSYLELQLATSTPSAVAARVHTGAALPATGRTDDLFVVGDCEALYLNTGDLYDPWAMVEFQPSVLEIDVHSPLPTSRTVIGRITGLKTREIVLETGPKNKVRFVVVDDGIRFPGQWIEPYAGEPVRIGVAPDPENGFAKVSSTPGGSVTNVPFVEWGTDWISRPARFQWTVTDTELPTGVTARQVPGRPLNFCRKVLRDAGRG